MYTQHCITLINPKQNHRSWFRCNRFNTKTDWYGICSITKGETSIWMDISGKGFSVQNYSKTKSELPNLFKPIQTHEIESKLVLSINCI